MSLLVTLKRGRKTKTVRVNPSPSRLKRAGYKRTGVVGSGVGGNRPWIEYYRGGRAMKGEPSTVYRHRVFKTIAERDRALFDNPKRRRKNPHSEQVELKLFIDSDGDLYRRIKGPIEKNLTKKFVKGTYNHKLAVKAWKYLADEGAKKYAKDFSIGSDWNRMFSVADRKEVAQQLADDWLAELKAGNRHNPKRCRSNPNGKEAPTTYGYPALLFRSQTPDHVPRLPAKLIPTGWQWYPTGSWPHTPWVLRLISTSGTVYHRRLHNYGYPTIEHAGKIYALDQPLPTLSMNIPGNLPAHRYVRHNPYHNPKRRKNPRVAKTKLVYVLQGYYPGHGWSDVLEEDTWKPVPAADGMPPETGMRAQLKAYRENDPGTPYRSIKRRVPKES